MWFFAKKLYQTNIPMNTPRLYVDFNELLEADLVLLSQQDIKLDSDGNEIVLFDGRQVDGRYRRKWLCR